MQYFFLLKIFQISYISISRIFSIVLPPPPTSDSKLSSSQGTMSLLGLGAHSYTFLTLKRKSRDGIFKLLGILGIDSASLCSRAGRYDKPIPTRFLAPVDCSQIPAQYVSLKGCQYKKYMFSLLRLSNTVVLGLQISRAKTCLDHTKN
jgi:hypothetical protein